ncbi:Lar family restriction alleviation protein [bacterium 210820-DFI.6.37]|nr:Lar family restriction alleviation protein [bacterium 210820-DFI.6.37]
MTDKLKPCPFCGGEELSIESCKSLEECEEFEGCNDDGYVAVVCDMTAGGCGSSSGYYKTKQEAIAAWNRRNKNEQGRKKKRRSSGRD